MKIKKKIRFLAAIMAGALCISACGTPKTEEPAASSASSAGTEVQTSEEASGELAGKPWVTSILQGNLSSEKPDVKDDLYTYFNYDFLTEHQEQPASASSPYADELKTTVLDVLKDDTKTSHDLDQMRIFFHQVMDTETLKKTGLSQVQPYLDRIQAVNSLEEMNRLLTADDFPFSPFIVTSISLQDTRETNIVTVNPNLLYSDQFMLGGTYYQDVEDPDMQANIDRTLLRMGSEALMDLSAQGMTPEEIREAYDRMLAFEKPHAKYLDYNGKYSAAEFGAQAKAAAEGFVTLDELCAACPNFPMKGILEKLGMENSPVYSVSKGWPEAFNGVWTEENLDVIKEIAALKVLNETRPYRDQTDINKVYEQTDQPVPDDETVAFKACDNLNTFAIALAETYVNEGLGAKAKERLTNLTQEIIDSYKDLVGQTPWIGEESRERIIEKLDHMTINMLEPADGYYDFSGLELVTTEQGGTLLDNYLKLKQYRLDQESKMVGQSASTSVPWHVINPTMANAFYDPNTNSINIIPGYINSFNYSDDLSKTELLAGIGFTIGHEISHGFDYTGAQYDAYALPTSVFADADLDAFVKKTAELGNYYKGIEIAPEVMVNGDNVVTEAAADLAGLQAVLDITSKSDEITYEDVFQIFAETWAQVITENEMLNYLVDTHPMNHLRINVCSQMFDPIYDIYGVKEGNGMYLAPEARINIWGPKS